MALSNLGKKKPIVPTLGDPSANTPDDPNAQGSIKDPPSGLPDPNIQIDPGTGGPVAHVDPSVKATKPVDMTGDILTTDPVTGEPQYNPANPDPWIIYNFKIGNNGQTPSAADLDYWHKKLASGEITGTGQPADYNYWGTRLRRQGVDDLNPQGAQKKSGGYLDAANQYGGLFGTGSYSGFLGSSMVPTDAGAFETLQQRIKDILGGGGGLDSRPLSTGAGAPSGSAGGGPAASTPVGSPAPASVTNANPAAPAYGTPSPATPVFTGGSSGNSDTRVRDAGILGGMLNQGSPNYTADQQANAGATVIPDRVAGGIASIFGLSPILAAGNAAQRFNHPGDIIFGNPPNGPQGPTDPNLRPTNPEEQTRNAQIVAQLLANNEANGGR